MLCIQSNFKLSLAVDSHLCWLKLSAFSPFRLTTAVVHCGQPIIAVHYKTVEPWKYDHHPGNTKWSYFRGGLNTAID